MKFKNYLIGIDISKLTLDVALLNQSTPKVVNYLKVSNNLKGLKEMVKWITKQNIDPLDCLFCCENTGVYTVPFSLFMSDNKMFYWVVSAIEIKRSKGLVRGKSDKADAKDIAIYALTNFHKYKQIDLPEKDIQKLKLLFTERAKTIKALSLFKTTSENQGFIPNDILIVVQKTNRKVIAELEKCLQAIESQLQTIIDENNDLKAKVDLLKSIPGIGNQTALYLLITTKGFTAFDNWRQMACYAGVAPFEYTSGTSIRGKTKVNHLADKTMKSMLQMCVLSAIKYDNQIKLYFEKKKTEGKNPMLVMNNIRCKLLARAFAVINRGTPFVKISNYAA
jgi:transposase